MSSEKKEMEIAETELKSYGVGIRHVQMLMMTLCATVIFVMRSSMGVAVISMTDVSQINATSVEIYEWSAETRGMILSSFFWGYTVMQIPAGILGKMYGGKPMLMMALVVNGLLCLATPALAKVGGWMAVCAVRVSMGLTQACFMPSVHTLLGQWAPLPERTRFGIISYYGIQLGPILTMPVCGLLTNTFLGWRLIFYTMGGLSLATAVLWWLLTASSPAEHRFIKEEEVMYIESSLSSSDEGKLHIPWRQILTSLPLLATQCAHIGVNWCFVIFLVEIPTYLKEGLKMNVVKGSSYSALPFVAQWILSTLASVLSDYLCNKKVLSITQSRKLFNTLGSVLVGVGLTTLSFLSAESSGYAVVVLTLTCGSLGFCTCGYMLNHLDLSPRFCGVIYAMTNCVANLIGLIGPLSTGFILGDQPTDPHRWRIVFCVSAAIIMLSDVVFRLFGTSDRQPWDSPRRSSVYEIGLLKRNSIKISVQDNKEEKRYSFTKKQ